MLIKMRRNIIKLYLIVYTFQNFGEIDSMKTAPEFKVTVDLENFKEIRIPFDLWKKIITRNYDPDGKFPLVSNIKENNITNKEDPTGIPSTYMSSQILHEVVLNVIVPPEAELLEDGTAVKPAVDGAVDLEISTEEVIIPVLQEEAAIAQDVLEVPVSSAQVVQAAPAGQAAQAVPTGQATGASPLAADSPASSIGGGPGSVLVQTARFPCACEGGICGCCTSFFQQKGCANIGFLPDEFAFEVKMTMNGNVLAKRKLPVSDPPPICFNPRRAPFLELCAQLNNIRLKNRNVHVCVDIDANVGGFELFSWNYSCLKFGSPGFLNGLNSQQTKKPAAGKPQQNTPQTGGFDLFGGGDDDEEEEGFFDGLLDDDY